MTPQEVLQALRNGDCIEVAGRIFKLSNDRQTEQWTGYQWYPRTLSIDWLNHFTTTAQIVPDPSVKEESGPEQFTAKECEEIYRLWVRHDDDWGGYADCLNLCMSRVLEECERRYVRKEK